MPADLQQLGEDLVTASARLVRAVHASLPSSLSVPQTRILGHLRDAGPLRIGQLAQRERCSQPTMTAHVARLERADFVHREPDPEDQRAVRLEITAAGRAELQRCRAAMGACVAAALAELPRPERAALAAASGPLLSVADLVSGTP